MSPGTFTEAELRAHVCRMCDKLVHRGPDDSGTWVDAKVGVALSSRRLAIVDLSPAGHQPMLSPCGGYVIVFNGEVYNFCELRRELEPKGHRFRGHSDTEVMLAAIREWGLEAAVQKFVGMFAFALWDRQERALHLVRDRLGIKPLYYGWAGKTFVFGSELKALRAHPDFVPEVSRDALALQLRHAYIPQPFSIYKDAYKLRPGCILTIKTEGSAPPVHSLPAPYWSAREVAERGAANSFNGSELEATEQLDTLLREAVRLRMIADVPLGAFLSGGTDSSTVVALMQAQSSRPVKTFTIGFREEKYDEAVHAKAVAAHLGTDHTELYVTPEETMAVIPKLPTLFDEPFSDASQIPTYLISALARQQVTVSLSGDGGDELFGGYPWHSLTNSAWKGMRWLPLWGRRFLASLITKGDPRTYDRRLTWLSPLLDRYGQPGRVGEKLHKIADLLLAEGAEEVYWYLASHWKRPSDVVLGSKDASTVIADSPQWAALPEMAQRMMFMDLVTYLPDDILVKVDRASMGVSLEARVPFLDHRVVEFAARLPLSLKIHDGRRKWLLRRVLYQYVPRATVDRPKMGFSVPIGIWLRGPLREWAEDLLSEDRLRREGYFNPGPIRMHWADCVSGQQNLHYPLWNVLMFQAWRARWESSSG